MKLVPLSSLFSVTYGVNLELNKMTPNIDGIPFVGRSERNNGVTARVSQIAGIKPNPAGTLSVAGGGSVLATFLQPEEYYSGRDLFYLTPLVEMSDSVKLYYCACIRANRYRYSYGRQANKTLKSLMLPAIESIPSFVTGGVERVVTEYGRRLAAISSVTSAAGGIEPASANAPGKVD